MTEEQAVEFLKEKGWGLITPQTYRIDMDRTFLDLWEKVEPFTMVSCERAFALYQSLIYLSRRSVEGAVVECGVWRGGLCMLTALMMKEKLIGDRDIWLYDTFAGMTDPGEKDIIAASGQAVAERDPKGWWAVSREEVESNLRTTGYNRWKTVEGDVLKTLEEKVPHESIALLRLDTDWYESTRKEMEVLFPRLKKGGILLLDDYGHFQGAARAVDEYFASQGIVPLLQRVDYTGRLYIKE